MELLLKRTLFTIFCLLVTLTSPSMASANTAPMTIGVLSFVSKEKTQKKWQPLARYLSETIPNQSFTIKTLFYSEFAAAIESQSIDYILTNPAHFIEIGQRFKLSGAIATLTELSGGKPQWGFGGVIFTRNTPDSPKTIQELAGKTVAAVSKSSLGGYQASAHVLSQTHIDLKNDVRFLFTGMPHCNVARKVLSGEADAGFVRTGILEYFLKKENRSDEEIRILNSQSQPGFNQHLSTTLYPEWPFIAMPHIKPQRAQRVAAALFLMDSHPQYTREIGIYGFTIPASYVPVEMLMIDLKLPPFDKTESITFMKIWSQYRYEMIVTLGLILTIISYALYKTRTSKMLSQKNQELNTLTEKLQSMNSQLEKISITDPLTGLSNRRHFKRFLQEKRQFALRYGTTIAVCLIDIDDFKRYNDTYGHHVGDRVLVEVAAVLEQHAQRAMDLAARYAGDEFIIVLYDITNLGLEMVARRIVQAVQALDIHVDEAQAPIKVSISMGITTAKAQCCLTNDELFHNADQALYKAKRCGKNCFAIH